MQRAAGARAVGPDLCQRGFERVHDLGAVRELSMLVLERVELFGGQQVTFQFLGLVAQQVEVARVKWRLAEQGLFFHVELLPGEKPFTQLLGGFIVAAGFVQQAERFVASRQSQMFVLAVDFHQQFAELGELLQGDGSSVDPGA